MIQVEIVQDVDAAWWNSLVHSVNGEFHQTAFYAAFCTECFRKKPYYAIVEENGTPLGIALFFAEGYGQDFITANFPMHVSGLPIPFLRSLWKCCSLIHGPLIFDLGREEEILETLLQEIDGFARAERVFLWKKVMPPVHNHLFNQDIWDRTFSQYGFTRELSGTFLVDLTVDTDNLWKNLKHSARKAIKKVKKQGASFVHITTEEDFRKYYGLLSETRKRKGLTVGIHYELLKDWWEKNSDSLQFFLVEKDGHPLAGQGVFHFHNIVREVFSGTSDYAIEHRLYGGDLLKFEVLKWEKEEGYAIYDLARVHPNPSTTAEKHIRQFKEKWGGEYVEFPVYSRIYGKSRHRFLTHVKHMRNWLK